MFPVEFGFEGRVGSLSAADDETEDDEVAEAAEADESMAASGCLSFHVKAV